MRSSMARRPHWRIDSGAARWLAAALILLCQCAMGAQPETPLRILGMDSRPISFLEDGKPAGLVVELAQEVGRRLGRNDPIEIMPWARAQAIALHERKVMLLSMMPTPDRAKVMVFAGPLFKANLSVFARADRAGAVRAAGPAFTGLRAGARRGSVFAHAAQRAGLNLTDETNNSELAARMLMQGRFDLWVEGEETAGVALEQIGYRRGDIVQVHTLGTEDVYFAFAGDTPPALVQAWNDALRDMKQDGSFLRIHRKWLPAHQLPSDMRAPGKLPR